MTRSHALLHCSNATLVAARAEAWDGRDPGSVESCYRTHGGKDGSCGS
jgi:hypothetical protein